MMPVVQGTKPTDTQGALAILSVVATDKRYRERLEELIQHAKEANDAIETLRVTEQAANEKLTAAEAMHDALMTEAVTAKEEAAAAKSHAEAMFVELTKREQSFEEERASWKRQVTEESIWLSKLKITQIEEGNEHKAKMDKDLQERTEKLNAFHEKLESHAAHLNLREVQLNTLLDQNQKKAQELDSLKEELIQYNVQNTFRNLKSGRMTTPADLPTPVILSGTFAGTGQSAACKVWGNFNVTLGGTWVGTVQIERSFDSGATWTVVAVDGAGNPASYTTPISLVGQEIEVGALYRLNCTAFTSGPVVYRVAVPQYLGRF